MLSGPGLAILLFLATSSPQPCRCLAFQPAGLQVNCSSQRLMEVPPLPPDTTELDLQDNQLTIVPPGYFDGLHGLRRISLDGNPFHCDCRIQYLRIWLQRNKAAVSGVAICASPSAVARTAIISLDEAHFSSCGKQSCAEGGYNALVGVMLCGLIALLLWVLRMAKNSTFTLDIDGRHGGFEAHSLRSLKPKHRKRLQSTLSEDSGNSVSLTWTDDLERPLIRENMEILPQILDVLHKKHNIKIKSI